MRPVPLDALPPAIGPTALAVAPRPGRSGVTGLLAPGLLHALVRDPDGGVRHYERAQDRPDRGWARGDLVSPDATAPGAIVVTGAALNAFVPEPGGIAHHIRSAAPRRATEDGHTLDPATWGSRGWAVPGRVVSAVAVRGDVVLAVADAGGVTVWRLREGRWQVDHAVEGASAPALAVRGGSVGLLVQVGEGGDPGLHLWERTRSGAWRRGVRLLGVPSAPAALVADGAAWLVAVPRAGVVATYRVRGREGAPHATLTWGAGRIDGVALVAGSRGGVQAVTAEEGSVFQHRRTPTNGWLRVNCLRLHDTQPFVVDPRDSTKLAQVSGEADSQPVREGGRRSTLSRSRTTSGVLGTDLGVHVHHRGRDFLLFGDTHWDRRPWLTTRDSIAEVLSEEGSVPGLPRVVFHGAPLVVRGGGVTMREYDVPLDGFSLDGDFHAFFTSNHFAGGQVMGRSVLTRAADPALTINPRARLRGVAFDHLGTFSRRYFLNVSVQPVPAASLPGYGGEGEVLLVFGSGPYRAGDLRLAVLDPRSDAVRATLAGGRGVAAWPGRVFPLLGRLDRRTITEGVRYFAGLTDGEPVWSEREADARPLLQPGAFGELSVRWVPEVGRFLLLAASGPGDPIGLAVTLRTAQNPWGPWSPRRRLLDWVARGMWFDDPYARFIKAVADGTDPVGDRIFRGQRDATGAAYAPYFYGARLDGDDLVLRYTLSTWNPYQVVLMEHRLSAADVGQRPIA